MSRSKKKNPERSCPGGRKRCRVCQMAFALGRVKYKQRRLTGDRGR